MYVIIIVSPEIGYDIPWLYLPVEQVGEKQLVQDLEHIQRK